MKDIKPVVIWAFLGGVGAVTALALLTRRPKAPPPPPVQPRSEIEKIIIDEANRQGVDPRIALLFADLESGLKPATTGDHDWPYREQNGVTMYERFVLQNDTYNNNPWRDDPSVWISYGLFQLLSPHYLYFYDRNAHPAKLLDPQINSKIAIKRIKNQIEKFGANDLVKVRLGYGASCLIPNRCSYETINRIVGRLDKFAGKWGLELGPDPIGYGWEVAQGLA